MRTQSRLPLSLALILCVAHAKIDWNLESTFLQHLQQQANETEPTVDEIVQAVHIYPTWVSEGTCSTKCVDIRGEEEFCVATSVCEHSTWRKAFDRHKSTTPDLNSFEPPMSLSSCEVWGDLNRCDGTLCDIDHECQSGCCGAFVSFTHQRCLPILGDYCAGRDTTRKQPRKVGENSLELGHDYDLAMEEHEHHAQKEALAQQAKGRMAAYGDISDIVEELVQLSSYMQLDSNEIPMNGRKRRPEIEEACHDAGHKDLCDDFHCEFDGMCRSGCCSQVLTKGYKRCAAMLVGDYCPRALDPIVDMIRVERELQVAAEALGIMAKASSEASKAQIEPKKYDQGPAVLPCNVFGTVDRCDGMACEHDGNCFSGCCSLFVSADQKRCMPLVGGDMCPIAIDVVEKFQIVGDIETEHVDQAEHAEEAYHEEAHHEEARHEEEDYETPLHYVDHKEHYPEDEKHDRYSEEDEDDRPMIEKREHHYDEHFEDLEDGVFEEDHPIIEKAEHHTREHWRPEFHGQEESHATEFAHHHYDHADGINENYLDDDESTGILKPIEPKKDDPRLKIPKGKSTAQHDHLIVPKEPVLAPEDAPRYGISYENERKEALRGSGPSAGLAPKVPIRERRTQVLPAPQQETASRKPCSAYGNTNRCEGMTCEADNDCASQCCGQMTRDGSSQCHALIEGMFCPRALATKVDYRSYQDDDHRRNALLTPSPRTNEMPTYRGKDGCKVHGNEEQCDGQPCVEDHDCHSGCCGHFVSFSLRRCLPLTDDSMCPRFLEPSFTSPIPARLPPIESTIKDMYAIQDRVHHLQEVMDPDRLPLHEDVLFCRAHGEEKLCDGFICSQGSECESGCCSTFGTLKHDYCQPLIENACPVAGFTYGPKGNIHAKKNAETLKSAAVVPDDIHIPTPPQFNVDGTGSKPPTEQKKENAFWNGVIVGVVIWIGVLVALGALYFCCKKNSPVSAANDVSQYQDLAASSH